MTRRFWFKLVGAAVAVPTFIRAFSKPTKPAIPSTIYLDVNLPFNRSVTLWQFTFNGQLYQWMYTDQTRQLLSEAHTAPVSILQEYVRHLAGENLPRDVFRTRFVGLTPSLTAKPLAFRFKHLVRGMPLGWAVNFLEPMEHVYDFELSTVGERSMFRHIIVYVGKSSSGGVMSYPLYPEFRDGEAGQPTDWMKIDHQSTFL